MLETLQEFTAFARSTQAAPLLHADSLRKAQHEHPVAWLLLAARAGHQLDAKRIDLRGANGLLTLDIRALPPIDGLYDAFGKDLLHKNYSNLLVQLAESLSGPLSLTFVDGDNQKEIYEISPGIAANTLPAGPCIQIAWKPGPDYPVKKILTSFQERLRFSPLAVFHQATQLNKPILHHCAHFSQAVKDGLEPTVRRNYFERIWLPGTPVKDQFMIADPFEMTAHRSLMGGRLYPGAPGITNVREICEAPSVDHVGEIVTSGLLSSTSKVGWKSYPPCYWNVYQRTSAGLGALMGAQADFKATTVGAVLRWGRPHRGTGLLFAIHQGVLLDPVDLGPEFKGCWAFVAAPSLTPTLSQGQVEPNVARRLLEDWTKSQFVHMGQAMESLLYDNHSTSLGLALEFRTEVRNAISTFQRWDEGQWGNPARDF